MLDIAVLDCCGPDDSAASRQFVEFLRRKVGDRAQVHFYDPDQPFGPEQVPLPLAGRLREQGANTVPILAIDGDMVAQGSLPDWLESLDIINSRLAVLERGN
ncbi:hypothetical protein AB0B85_01465 [Micromonospora sp. NPDC049044]|uniref:hypothetical protein n=1 Tax=unclassified Micromonospora TaxID=2617518 RepID=UPI0033F6CAF6